ncbi:MAG: hypothetical protein E7652_00800 [Ruminococcaceae bacterium]|nr:hypothetical protein [Oscillospiraceae bacterium]
MKLRSFIALFLASLLLLSACSKEKDEAPEKKRNKIKEAEKTEACIKSEHYSIDLNIMTYCYFDSIYSMKDGYGAMLGSMAPSQTAPDFTMSLSLQYYDYGTHSGQAQTWHEFFINTAVNSIQNDICYAEAAIDEGFEYDGLDEKVDGYIEKLKLEAENESLEFEDYLIKYYGTSVAEKDIRGALELQIFSSAYKDKVNDDKAGSVTDRQLESYRTDDADDAPTKNVHHILLTADKYGSDNKAKAKAEEVLAEYNKGKKGVEAFEAVAEKYNEDGSSFYENVTEGVMVAEFNDWLFDDSRKVGDTDIVKTEYGYHVMYFDGDGLPTWKADAIESIVSEEMTAFESGLFEIYKDTIIYDTESIRDVPDILPYNK